MATEIERKFLLCSDGWRAEVSDSRPLRQGYLISDDRRSVRVRISGSKAELNIKSAVVGISRQEYEYAIPVAVAEEMLATLCHHRLEKTRHLVQHSGHTWEIDEFSGTNSGLILAEVELAGADDQPVLPDWVGEEVSEDIRYYNSYLAEHPYNNW